MQKHPFYTEGGLIPPLLESEKSVADKIMSKSLTSVKYVLVWERRNDNPVHELHFHKNGSAPRDPVQWLPIPAFRTSPCELQLSTSAEMIL